MLPATKNRFGDLIDKLNEMREKGCNQLELKRLKKYAEDLLAKHPADGYTALGIIACFEDRLEDMHRFHKNAIQISSEEPIHLANYAVSLETRNLIEEAFHYMKMAYEMAANDIEERKLYLNMVIDYADQLGLEDEVFYFADAWKALTGHTHWVVDLGFDEEDERDTDSILDGYADEIEKDLETCAPKIDRKLFEEVDELIRDVRD